MNVMAWPALSSDMNVIENCWGTQSRALYHGGSQFDTLENLCKALTYEWDNLNQEVIRNLITSVPRRVM